MIEVPPRACRPIHEATPSLAVPRSRGGIMSITRIPTVALITLTTALLGCGADQDPAAPGLAAASASSASISASSWGPETAPQVITTDWRGTGRADLFRNLGTTAIGSTFDIHFRVIDASGAVVLESSCYQFVVTQ